MRAKTAITGLRIISALVIVVGLCGAAEGLLHAATIPLFVFDVPSWIVGVSAAYMGLRYWRRIPELERNVRMSGGFSSSNFPRARFWPGSRRS